MKSFESAEAETADEFAEKLACLPAIDKRVASPPKLIPNDDKNWHVFVVLSELERDRLVSILRAR